MNADIPHDDVFQVFSTYLISISEQSVNVEASQEAVTRAFFTIFTEKEPAKGADLEVCCSILFL